MSLRRCELIVVLKERRSGSYLTTHVAHVGLFNSMSLAIVRKRKTNGSQKIISFRKSLLISFNNNVFYVKLHFTKHISSGTLDHPRICAIAARID